MSLERLTPRQVESVRAATARLNVWDGAVSSGKTVGSLVRWLQFVRQGPPGELLMVGKTERTLKRNVIDLLVEYLGTRRAKLVAGSGELWLLGRRVYLAGANDERSEGKIRGLSLVGAYGDELTLWPESFFRMLLTRLRRPGAALFGTTNPDSPNHWLKRDFLDREDELNLRRQHFKLRDNPILPAEYIEALEAEYTGLWRKRFVDGLWVIAEGAIYDAWDPDVHVVDQLPPMRYTWVAVDYGTSNPFVALLLGLGVDGRVYVCSEYRYDSRPAMRQKSDEEYSRDVRAWLVEQDVRPRWIFVDPSAASWIVQARRDRLGPVTDAENAVADGIRQVSRTLARRLRVHRSCQGLIDEFPGYVWDPKKQEHGLDEPVKADDHSLDALRYGIASSEHIWANVPVLEAA